MSGSTLYPVEFDSPAPQPEGRSVDYSLAGRICRILARKAASVSNRHLMCVGNRKQAMY